MGVVLLPGSGLCCLQGMCRDQCNYLLVFAEAVNLSVFEKKAVMQQRQSCFCCITNSYIKNKGLAGIGHDFVACLYL